ncbi:coiled-coil domain-containing protein 188 isoform X3 [Notamacropus eugenii]|uniref:coiled-coil domain-containing protein 188 isoform X3 n=1 Tax=Notamacropus eugenii TaxID=9315 RepID=UPI003B683708
MMDDDSWINPHGEFRQRLQEYPPPPPPPRPPPMQSHSVSGQPRLLRCSVVNLSPYEERNAILELEQANQRLEKDYSQMVDEPRRVEVLKQKIYPHEDTFTEKSQKELHKRRLSFEKQKTSITEVWDGMSEVHMSLTDQAEGLLNLKKDIRDVLDEVEDIRMEILRVSGTVSAILDLHRDRAQCQMLTKKGRKETKETKPSQPPSPKKEDNQSCSRKSWTVLTKAALGLFACSVLFYLYGLSPSPLESLLASFISQRTIWGFRTWCNPFLRVEVDDFLPF